MRGSPLDTLRRARRQVRADLRTDPYLLPILALAALLAGFWIHHRLPNFATRDERWRVVDVVEPLGFVLERGDLSAIRDGVIYWRSYGATFYLYGVVTVPTVLLVALVDWGILVDVAYHPLGDFWGHWLRVPGWVWTALVLPARLTNVALAVGCVYLTYRIGVTLRDRATGRLGALLVALTWALVVLAHEAGEDVPALFAFLLSLYFALRYVEDGGRRPLYWGSLWGGLATGLKLSGGISAVVLAAAVAMRLHRASNRRAWLRANARPVAAGAALGAAVILASYPSVLVGAPEQLGGRILRGTRAKGDTHGWVVAPTGWFLLRGYLHGLGLPLALGSAVGVGLTLRRLRAGAENAAGLVLVLVGAGAGLAVVLPWAYVRTHHILPTMPLLVVLLAAALVRLRERRPAVARPLVALLVVTSAVYAGVGTLGYATQPRDRGTAWLAAEMGPNETIETYTRDPQEAPIPHDARVNHLGNRTMTVDGERETLSVMTWTFAMPRRCPDYIVLTYQRSLLFVAPDSHNERASRLSYAPMAEYVRDLLAEDTYPYAVAREFGPRPRFLDDRPPRETWRDLLRTGVVPRTPQYGDPQDFGIEQYAIVLERTGQCEP
jgi:hypothetical protein